MYILALSHTPPALEAEMAVWTPNTRDPASRGVSMTSAPDGVIYLIEASMMTLNTGGIVRLGMIFHEVRNDTIKQD
jgi:hypothetical protein